MAFSEENFNKICKILRVTKSQLTYQITLLATDFTAQDQTDIEAEIVLWDAGAGRKTTKIHPNAANKGVETKPEAVKQQIRENIAYLLQCPEWANNGSGITVRALRG